MALNIKPLGDRVLVEPVEEKETKKGGIVIPDTAKEKPQEGIVRALGTGKTDDDGKEVPFTTSSSTGMPRKRWPSRCSAGSRSAGRAGNGPEATGARGPRVLGRVTPA